MQCNAINKKVQRTPFEAETLALQGILCLHHSKRLAAGTISTDSVVLWTSLKDH